MSHPRTSHQLIVFLISEFRPSKTTRGECTAVSFWVRFRVFEMASSSASLTAAESQQLQKLLAKAKSAALPSGSTVSFPRVEPTYDPATGLVCHHEFGLCENVWDAAELWDESEPEIYGTMSDAAKRREADERPPAEHHPKRVTMATGRNSTGESVMYAPTRVAMPYPSGTTEDQLPVHH